MRRVSGVSLVEMVLALTIFSLLSASVYVLLHMGLRHRGVSDENREQARQVRMMYQFFSRDAANALNWAPQVPFEGEPGKVSFVTLLDSWSVRSGESRRLPARVTYAYDPGLAALVRRVAPSPQDFEEGDGPVVFKATVANAEFSFPFLQDGRYRWKPRWENGAELPPGIRVRMAGYETVVSIPMGKEISDE